MYISFEEYTALYDSIEEKVFNRLAFDAGKYLDKLTTGIDGVKKLKAAMPADEDDKASVTHCAAAVIDILSQIDAAERSAASGRSMIQTENGVRGGVIASVSAGNESVTYSTSHEKTAIDVAAGDVAARDAMIYSTIRRYLSGVADANGINLLYMGPYPR